MVPCNILIVEDDAQLAALQESLIQDLGTVRKAETVAEARLALKQAPVDLAVIDGRLPDGSGIDLIRDIRKAAPELRILFVSEFWRDLQSFHMLTRKLNVQRVMNKPFTASQFRKQVQAVLETEKVEAEDRPTVDLSESVDLDQGLAAIRPEYAQRLEGRLQEVGDALDRLTIDAAALQVADDLSHTIHGSSGTFGFKGVSEATGRIQRMLREVVQGRADLTEGRLAAVREAYRDALTCFDRERLSELTPTTEDQFLAKILVVDRDVDLLDRLERAAADKLVRVLPAPNEEQALEWARTTRFDAAFIDLQLHSSDGSWNDPEYPFKFARLLRSIDGLENLQLGFISPTDSVVDRVAAAHAGGSVFLTKPIGNAAFLRAVDNLTAIAREDTPKVLVVDDDPDQATALRILLEREDMAVTCLLDAGSILTTLAEVEPDILLLDIQMPVLSGFDVCKMLRASARWRDLPIIMMTARDLSQHRIEAFTSGADDYLTKPFVREELIARVNTRLERIRLLRRLADTDPLSGLLLRRAFSDALAVRMDEAIRADTPISVALIDLDHFKSVNDTYGHLAGDRVLAGFGKLLASRFRGNDLRGRWGGEEFSLAMVGMHPGTAGPALERALGELKEVVFKGDHGEAFNVSFSAGVACFPEDGTTMDRLFKVADSRLYAAKEAGRSRVVISDPTGSHDAILGG